MLDEYRQLYTESADLIGDWKKLSKNDLANLYLENENNEKANSYLSALVCKFWNLIGHFYYKQGIVVASETDCYDWIIEGILEALKDRAWKNPENKLFNDPKGPEKAIMVNIMCIRANFYQYAAYDKRKLNYNSYSLEEISDNCSDGLFVPYLDNYDYLTDYISVIVNKYFELKDYFVSFFLDALCNFNIVGSEVIDIKKWIKFIKNSNESYLVDFSTRYHIKLDDVKAAFDYIARMPMYRIHHNVSRTLNLLRKDLEFKSMLEK